MQNQHRQPMLCNRYSNKIVQGVSHLTGAHVGGKLGTYSVNMMNAYSSMVMQFTNYRFTNKIVLGVSNMAMMGVVLR